MVIQTQITEQDLILLFDDIRKEYIEKEERLRDEYELKFKEILTEISYIRNLRRAM